MPWKFLHIGFSNDEVLVGGHNIWDHKWISMHAEPIVVPHPSYPDQRHTMDIYKLDAPGEPLFAAGEFSNGVWGTYIPE